MANRVHVFQHVDYEDPGYILTWCAENKKEVTTTRFYENDIIPDTDQFDYLIVMGGPMGVYDEKKYPWLIQEKAAIDNAIRNNIPIVGICLGAQLIASVLGAAVYKNGNKEIGWFEIKFTPEAFSLPFMNELPGKETTVFHWHGDTFDLPEKSILLASSAGCKNQAFMWGSKVIGLQFHFEVTEMSLESMVNHGIKELTEGKFIQKAEEILKNKAYIPDNNKTMAEILEWLFLHG